MLESPSKEQVLIQELLHKLDAERLKNARLESELSQYKEPAKMKKDLESRIKEQDIIIKKKDKTIDQLNQRIAWLNRKFWGQSTERHASEDPAQLSFKFAELKLTPEEEAAYKKAEAEAEAFRQQRKAASDKRQEKNRPTRKPLPENLRREVVHLYPVGYNEEEWELLPESFDEISEVLSVNRPSTMSSDMSATRLFARTRWTVRLKPPRCRCFRLPRATPVRNSSQT